MLKRLDVELHDMGVLTDDRETIRAALDRAGQEVDVIITSGGVSAGAADFVKTALEELGQVGFWKIAIGLGRPLPLVAFTSRVLWVTGNPVAVMVTFYQFVREALRVLSGETAAPPEPMIDARLTTRLRKTGRVEYYRGILDRNERGELTVRTTSASSSGLLHTMSDANCFIVLSEDIASQSPALWCPFNPSTVWCNRVRRLLD